MESETLSAAEAAALLRLHHETVRRYCAGGVFPHAFKTPFGHAWRIPRSDVEALMRQPASISA